VTHISVMVPVYNRENLIEYTLESIMNQSHTDFNLTIVDDGSTDATVNIVDKYQKDPRVKLIQNKENLGLTRNWNHCLELARGPLVQIMQSDDLMDADYLERVNRIFEIYPEVGFVSAACRYINAKGEMIGLSADQPDCIFNAGDEAVTAILTYGFPHVSSIIMRKSALDQIGKINEEIWHGPDVEFDTRLASQFNYYKIGNICTSFRRHGTNRGNLEYFRKDYMEIHILKMKLAWGYLSDYGKKKLGIKNLSTYINNNAANMAIGGAILMVAYGKYGLGRYYLTKAVELNPKSILIFRFWKAVGVNLFPIIGQRLMMNRFKFSTQDLKIIGESKLQ
jgi:glycosyltransferase involved in cell wall biosynthesis